MDFIDRERLREEMNRNGMEGRAFLWGISYDCGRGFLLTDPLRQTDVLWHMGEAGNDHLAADGDHISPQMRIVRTLPKDDYRKMFEVISRGLQRGDSFLANLTGATEVECTGSFRDIFHHSSAPYRLVLGEEFVCFSPEPFVRIENGRISAFPMKGTADASLPDAEAHLMEDYKEMCEHYTIVDLMRNDLNSVASDVCVDRFRYVEEIATSRGNILQTSSEISGKLPENMARRFGDVILPLLPAGSITGAPKEATVALIDEAEPVARGWYTGVFGYFDGTVMQTAVMIRCLQRSADRRIYFHSGGGLTVNSDANDEYDELLAKVYLSK